MDLIRVSFIIAIFGVNSKINVLCENVSAFVYQAKKNLNLQVESSWESSQLLFFPS